MSIVDVRKALWDDQSRWSQAADAMKTRIERARVAALVLACATAVLGALSGTLAGRHPVAARVLAGAAAASAALLPVLRPRWSGTALRSWTRARSVSEHLKAETYLSLAGVGPYASDPDGSELRSRTAEALADAADLQPVLLGVTPVPRALPAVHDPVTYFAVRVTDQIDGYYLRKAAQRKATLRRFSRISSALAVAGVVLGVVVAAGGAKAVTAWIAVATTLAAAVGVHIAASRTEFELIEYSQTAERLRQLRGQAAEDGADAAALVAHAEDVISAQNQGWMAKAGEDPPHQSGA